MTSTTALSAHLRQAREDDLSALRDILNVEILTSTASWTTIPKTLDDMIAWHKARIAQGFPVYVAQLPDRDDIVGYGSYGPFRNGQGYAGTVEHTVYVHEAHRGRGIASCLIDALVKRAENSGLRVMIGAISSEAEGSLLLHRRLGFRFVGRIPSAGMKFGRELDLVLMSRQLRTGPSRVLH